MNCHFSLSLPAVFYSLVFAGLLVFRPICVSAQTEAPPGPAQTQDNKLEGAADNLPPSILLGETYMKPSLSLLTVGISITTIGVASCVGGLIAFHIKNKTTEKRDNKYEQWLDDPESIDESAILNQNDKARSAWIAGWSLVSAGAGIFVAGSVLTIMAIKQRIDARKYEEMVDIHTSAFSIRRRGPRLVAGAFSDGRLTALLLRISW